MLRWLPLPSDRATVASAGKILGNGFTLLILFTLLTSFIAYTFMEPILLFTVLRSIRWAMRKTIFPIICWGLLFVEVSTWTECFINAQGRPAVAMCSVLIGALLNIILDPIFIFWLDMGVKGAALATVLSQACSAVWVLSFLFSRRASLPLERRYMKLEKSIVLSMLALGVSPFIMASTESLVGFVLNSSLKEFGDIYVSALTVLQTSMQFASVPLTGFAQGFVPVASYNYGHGDKQRVKECFRIALITMFSFNLVLMLFMICFPADCGIRLYKRYKADRNCPLDDACILGRHDDFRVTACLSEYVRGVGAGQNIHFHSIAA